jgi:hypothetical protein
MATEEKKGFIDDRKQFAWFALLDKAQNRPEEITIKDQKVLKKYGFEVRYDEDIDKYEFIFLKD